MIWVPVLLAVPLRSQCCTVRCTLKASCCRCLLQRQELWAALMISWNSAFCFQSLGNSYRLIPVNAFENLFENVGSLMPYFSCLNIYRVFFFFPSKKYQCLLTTFLWKKQSLFLFVSFLSSNSLPSFYYFFHRWFHQGTNPYTGTSDWLYSGGYFDRNFSDCPDIYWNYGTNCSSHLDITRFHSKPVTLVLLIAKNSFSK